MTHNVRPPKQANTTFSKSKYNYKSTKSRSGPITILEHKFFIFNSNLNYNEPKQHLESVNADCKYECFEVHLLHILDQ